MTNPAAATDAGDGARRGAARLLPVADIFTYLLSFATAMEIDLSDALAAKMTKNDAKYPVEEYYGSFARRAAGE